MLDFRRRHKHGLRRACPTKVPLLVAADDYTPVATSTRGATKPAQEVKHDRS